MVFLNQPRYVFFFFLKAAELRAYRGLSKREINIDNKKAVPFCFVFFFFFHLCGGGRISGAGDSFDKPPRLSTQAHVKLSQLWLRSLHTITTRGTKGNSKKKKKKKKEKKKGGKKARS